MKYRSEIDGLRALAVLPVVIFHAGFSWLPSGFLGVDIFFVISGYLITDLVLTDISLGTFSLRAFYERRARRILPALFVVVICCFPFAFFLMDPNQFKLFGASAVSVVLFSSNYFFYQHINYFEPNSELYPLLHTWSLGVEEQFYLFLPLLMVALYAKAPRKIVAVISGLLAASFLITQFGGNFRIAPPFVEPAWGWINPPTWNFFLLPSRASELLLGSLPICVRHFRSVKWHGTPFTIVDQILSAAGLAVICVSFFVRNPGLPDPGLFTIAPTCGALLVLLFAKPGTIAQRFLSQRVLVTLGLVSYSLYLWHQPIFAFARIAHVTPLLTVQKVGLVIVAGVLAFLSWWFIERPFRDRTRIGAKTIWSFAVGGSLVLLCAGTLVWTLPTSVTYGWRLRNIEKATQETEARQLSLWRSAVLRSESRACHFEWPHYRKPQDACTYYTPNATVAVIGDSHGVELAGAIADRLKPLGEGVKQFTFSGCAPMFGQDPASDHCAAWTGDVARFVAADPRIRTVVIAYRVTYYLEKWPQNRDRIIQSYLGILNYFHAAGKQVVLSLPAPELDENIPILIRKSTSSSILVSCERQRWTDRLAFVKASLRSLPKDIIVVDPAELFCDEFTCYAADGGAAFYADDNHPSIAGAKRIVDAIFHALGR